MVLAIDALDEVANCSEGYAADASGDGDKGLNTDVPTFFGINKVAVSSVQRLPGTALQE
jgi:hypothetical protein